MADPRAVATRAADPVIRTLASLARAVTEAPWTLSPADLRQAHAAGLPDAMILQVVLLSAYFGHLNRVADAVGIELDYAVQIPAPPAEPATPRYLRPAIADWPDPDGRPALSIALREGASEPLWAWRDHALMRDAPLDRRQRALIAYAVAECLGDAATVRAQAVTPQSPQEQALVATAQEVTLAPFSLGAGTIAPLRAAGLADDAAIFDAIATAAACTTFSRIAVALAALGA